MNMWQLLTNTLHRIPRRPPSSDAIPNDIPDVDTSPGGEPPLNHNKKQLSPDPDATIDYIQFLATTYFSVKAFTSEKEREEEMRKSRLHTTCCKTS